MHGIKHSTIILLLLLFAALVSGCASSPEPVAVETLDLTFTGDACVYEGPEWIKPGSISLNFVNEGDMQVAFNSIRHLDNKTHEDMVESLGGDTGPLFGHAPEWTEELGTFEWIKPGKVFNWEGDLEPGLYTIAVQRMSGAVWYCVGLTVVE